MFDQSQFLDEVTQRLIATAVDKTIEFYIRRHSPQQSLSKSFDSQKAQNIVDAIVEDDTSQWRSKKLDFFDFYLSSFYEIDSMIKNDKNLYYRNVHFFCERIHDLTIIKNKKLIKANLNTCLRDTVFIWYIAELNDLKRFDIRNLSLNENWINELKKRFKSNHFAIINSLIVEQYTIVDVRSEREPFDYVQQIVSHVKNVNFQNIQQQFTWTWKKFNVDLKRNISTFNVITILTEFLIAMKNKKKVW